MNVARGVDLVLVPTDLEGALECAQIGPHLMAEGLEVRWAVPHPGRIVDAWSRLSGEVPLTGLDEDHGASARYLLFTGSHEFAAVLARNRGSKRILLRPTGVDAFRSYRRGYPRMYRAADRVLMRSRLEVAELGDRPHRLVASGAGLGSPQGRLDDAEVTVLVTDDVARLDAPHAWIDSVTAAVRSAGRAPVLAGTERAAEQLPGLVAVSRDPGLLARLVVLPASQEVALVRAFGGTPVLVGEGFDTTHFSPVWVDAHPACEPADLPGRLGASAPPGRADWCEELVRLRSGGSVEDWAADFLRAVG